MTRRLSANESVTIQISSHNWCLGAPYLAWLTLTLLFVIWTLLIRKIDPQPARGNSWRARMLKVRDGLVSALGTLLADS